MLRVFVMFDGLPGGERELPDRTAFIESSIINDSGFVSRKDVIPSFIFSVSVSQRILKSSL